MKGDTTYVVHSHNWNPSERDDQLVQCTKPGCGYFLAEAICEEMLSETERATAVANLARREVST